MTPISYLQTDRRWASNNYSAPGESTNIGRSGCGIACTAMVIASLADPSVTPEYTAKWSMAHGYKAKNQGTYYSYFKPQLAEYGIKCDQVNGATVYHGANSAASVNKKMVDSVKTGNWIICCMGPGDWTSSGHFVLWYGVDGDYALIRDPNSTKASRIKAKVATLQYQVKYYFEIKVSEFSKKGLVEQIMEDGGKFVIDVSKHNGVIDWSQVKVDGVIMKLGYRGYETAKLSIDPQYNNNVQGCIKNNLAFGVYWFTTAITEAEAVEEAEFVLSTGKGLKLYYPIFIDSEYDNDRKDGRSDNLSKAQRTKCIKAFCDRIQKAGYVAGIYASESWLKDMLDVDQLPYRYWIANYSKRPTYHNWDGWQRSNKGTVNGISGDVDVSEWLSEQVIYDPSAAAAPDPEEEKPEQQKVNGNKWSEEAREWAVQNGIVKGDGSGINWNDNVTLERLIVILHRISKLS